MPARHKRSIHAQLLQLSMLIVAISSVLSLACALYVILSGEQSALDRNLINSASILSQSPLVRQALEGEASPAELAEFLDAATANTSDIDLILVGDLKNTLFYAPDPALRGTLYSGDAQNPALSGAGPYTSNETGPLGSEHSAYAPIRNGAGEVIGFVVVGLYWRSLAHVTLVTVLQMVLLGLLAMGVAVLLAQRLSRRIKNALQGYEPEAFARAFTNGRIFWMPWRREFWPSTRMKRSSFSTLLPPGCCLCPLMPWADLSGPSTQSLPWGASCTPGSRNTM